MKVRNATITNFRGLKDLHLDFVNPRTDAVRNLTCLIGDNGSGKTSALQAIALVIALATRRIPDASRLGWHGFLRERVSSLGPTHVELEVEFTESEIAETQKLFELWYSQKSDEWRAAHVALPPSSEARVTLQWDNVKVSSPSGFAAVNQFLGRYYMKSLLTEGRGELECLKRVGDIFWFDQFRNLVSRVDVEGDGENGEFAEQNNKTSWQAGIEQLREYLVGMWAFHTIPEPKIGTDYLAELEPRFNQIFAGTRFVGIAPMIQGMNRKATDFYFELQRSGPHFDITEMSSGEQAVFTLLYEFVRLGITNSVVLIDELELHLHPPQQQALLSLLRRIGPDCQFIVTTHSRFLTDVIPNEQVHRMEGGRRCL